MKTAILSILIFLSISLQAQTTKPFKVQTIYPKDKVLFEAYNKRIESIVPFKKFGKTTMIIKNSSKSGNFIFIFKKQKVSKKLIANNKGVKYIIDTHQDKNGVWQNKMGEITNDTVHWEYHNLNAFIFEEIQEKLIEKIKFQDAGNGMYWPEFEYPYCNISDENNDGKPEFYLTYFGNSDGLDAKLLKVIVYTFENKNNSFTKNKATAYYPAGNEQDIYYVDYTKHRKKLPATVQQKVATILSKDKIKRKQI